MTQSQHFKIDKIGKVHGGELTYTLDASAKTLSTQGFVEAGVEILGHFFGKTVPLDSVTKVNPDDFLSEHVVPGKTLPFGPLKIVIQSKSLAQVTFTQGSDTLAGDCAIDCSGHFVKIRQIHLKGREMGFDVEVSAREA